MALIEVKRARDPDGAIEDAPTGTVVHLAQTGQLTPGRQTTLTWEQFTVKPDGGKKFLEPASAMSTIKPGVAGPFWCVWGAKALVPGADFEKVKGFGWPLLARFNKKGALVLPNTRELNFISYNLTGVPRSSGDDIAISLKLGTAFLDDLHIRVIVTEGTVPKAMAGAVDLEISLDQNKNSQYELVRPGTVGPPATGRTSITPQPDLGDKSWRLPSDLTHYIALYWVNDFFNIKVTTAAMAFPQPQVQRRPLPFHKKLFKVPECAFVFLDTVKGARNRIAHEVAHCLLYEPGLGKDVITTNLSAQPQVQSFLGRLGIEGPTPGASPGKKTFDRLPQGVHSYPPSTDNLMLPSGGAALLDWQVAVIRASKQIGDGP